MAEPFPITIDGRRYKTARALADDIADRGERCVLPDRGAGHPAAYYARWMRADETGTTTAAVLAACRLLIDAPPSGDAFDHAVQLTGSNGSEGTTRALLDRVQRGAVPDSRWFGDSGEIALRTLVCITHAVQTKLPDERGRLAELLEAAGDSYGAASLLLSGGAPDPAVVSLVARWAGEISEVEVRPLARRTARHPALILPMARALAGATEKTRVVFQDVVDTYTPERSEAVAAALARPAPSGADSNQCQGSGLLSNLLTPMPVDPGDFYGRGRLDLVPCSHLVCGRCGQRVRHVDGREIPDGTDLAVLHQAEDWERSERLRDTALPIRSYACRCAAAGIVADVLIDTRLACASEQPLPWACGGHPVVRGRIELDGVAIDDSTDWADLVLRALAGDVPGGLDAPWASHPAIWVLRLFGRFQGHPAQAKMGEGLAEALRAQRPSVRSEALTFYLQHPFGPGSQRLISTARTHPELFSGVPAPDAPEGETLEFQLLRVLACRLERDRQQDRVGDVGALELLRDAARAPGLAGATLPVLSAIDTDWVLTHRLAIARAGTSNALALSIWIGNNAAEHEQETDALLIAEGLLSEGDLVDTGAMSALSVALTARAPLPDRR